MKLEKNNLKKYIDIYKEQILIRVKVFLEYKINFWMMNFFDIISLSTYILFYSTLMTLIGDLIQFTITEFILFWFLHLLAWKMLWIHNLREFNYRLLKGEINDHLVRPVNTYFLSSIKLFSGNNFISLFYVIPIVIGLIFYNNYELKYIILGLGLLIFSWFYFIISFNFIESTAFFIKQNSFIRNPFHNIDSTLFKYTPKTFENSSFKDIVYLFPVSVQTFLVIYTLKGNTDLLFHYFPYIFLSFVILVFGTIKIWELGLKKYEGFN